MHNSSGFNKELDKKRFEIISKELVGDRCLEIGCGNGHMTKKLKKHFKEITVIESGKAYAKEASKIKGVEVINKKLEDAPVRGKYHTIICCNVLEHVKDMEGFLEKIKKFSYFHSRIIFSVPNAYSYNRILGKELDIISDPKELDTHDLRIGHVRTFTRISLYAILEKHGFKINNLSTRMYKPFPNSMMEQLPRKLKDYCLNLHMSKCGAEIFAIARLK